MQYVLGSQRYIQAMVKSAESLEKGSSDQKAVGSETVKEIEAWIKYQDTKMYDAPPEGVQMWMNLHLARAYVFAGKTDAAVEKGFKKVREIDPERFGPGARKWAWRVLLTSMMFEALALFDKAEKTGVRKDYEAARHAIGYQFGTQASGTVLGVRSQILKGRVLGRLKENSSAIGELNRGLEAIKALRKQGDANPESKYADDLRWRALQAMSEIVLVMLQEGGDVDVPVEVLIEAGKSRYRQSDYEGAVNCFRLAVTRSAALDYTKRATLPGEPNAWYYMGIAFYRMDRFLEAQLAYEGALDSFLKHKMPEAFTKDAKNKKIIKRIEEEVLMRCAANGRIAASRERAMNPSEFNKQRFLKWIDWEIELDEEKRKDKPYYYAVAIMDSAEAAAREANELQRDGNLPSAREKRAQALDLYKQAKEQFLALPKVSVFHEEGLYLAGVSSYQAMSVLSYKKQTAKEKGQASDLAKEALKQFDVYEAYVKENVAKVRATDPQRREQELQAARKRRKSHKAAIALYRPFIHFDLGDYKQARASAEKLRNRKDLDAAQVRSLHRILFKCYVELGTLQKESDPAALEKLLVLAEGEAEWFKKAAATAPAEERESLQNSYDFYLNRLATAYGEATKAAIRMGKGQEFGRKFQAKRGHLINRLLENPKYQTIDGLGLVAKLFIELQDYDEARKAYEKILEKFDPDNDRMGKKDEELLAFSVLTAGEHLRNTPNIDTGEDIRRARTKLQAIEILIKGQELEKDPEGKILKPEIAKDFDKADRAIEAFFRDYPKYDSKKGSKAGPGREGLDKIKEELRFRLKLLRAANGKTICRVNLGEKLLAEALNEKGEAKEKLEKDAKDNFLKGLESAKDALKYWPKDADVRYNMAVCLLHAGGKQRLEESLGEFDKLRAGSRYGGDIFWKATQGAVRAMIELGEYDKARTILAKLMLTDPEGVGKGWPDIKQYMESVAKKKGITLEEFCGKEIDPKTLARYDYQPKSDLERLVEKKINIQLAEALKKKEIKKDVHDQRVGLLKELVQLSKDGKLVGTGVIPDGVAHDITAGRVTSLKVLGGKSRGEELDKHQPKVQQKEPEGGGAEKEKEKDADAGLVSPVMGGIC
ncbi:MAG: tetratricopeptide repeat protein [Planctomycetota bacterium]